MLKRSLTLVLGTYKEGQNLKKILPDIVDSLNKTNIDFEILVVDTQCPLDDTPNICVVYDTVRYINRFGGNNYGAMFRTAQKEARKEKIAFMDADGSHNVADLLNMYSVCDKYDLIIGSRYALGGRSDNPFFLRIQSHILNFIFRYLLGIKAKDISNSMRIYDTNMLKETNLKAEDFDILQEVLIKLQKRNKNFKIKEIPIHFYKRGKGISHRQFFPFLISFTKTFFYLFKIKWFERG